ncbi:MAG: hypothetical protein KC442_07250 [Thermomicrobiales bacterium]|nr:hypothetical protein [Thermomicrobiales bacterium]
MVQAIITPANAQRWQAALDRAISNALDVYVSTDGSAFVESASTPGLLYAVSRESCTCPAGVNGRICQHRACYLAQIGELGPQEPAGVELVQWSTDRSEIRIDGAFFGFANMNEYGGWEVFQGRFPHARRFPWADGCTLEEVERLLQDMQPVALPVSPAAQPLDLVSAAV